MTILAEGAQRQRFRCVEYATITVAAARSIGLPARVLELRAADTIIRAIGSSHVVAEVWLPTYRTWAMADAQWGVVPQLEGRPLDAVALQDTLAKRKPGLRFVPPGWPLRDQVYAAWIGPYLYYFDIGLDQRLFAAPELKRPDRLVLVRAGQEVPATVTDPVPTSLVTTHSPSAFYAPPP